MRKTRCLPGFLLVALFLAPTSATEPPDRINYQGVLRDAEDTPLNGDYDMIFRFFELSSGDNEILVDQHLAAGTGAVTVNGGMFNVHLGGGDVVDGAAPHPNDPYDSLAKMFADFSEVWLRIDIDPAGTGGGTFEELSPRVRVVAAAYALNAAMLGGEAPGHFLNSSGTSQEKTGLLIASGGVDYGPGVNDDLTSADVATLTSGASADALHTHNAVGSAGNADRLDSMDSTQFLRSDASDTFSAGVLTLAGGAIFDGLGIVKATRFTDRDNTSYHVDPSGTSTLTALRLNGATQYVNFDGPDGDQTLYFFDAGLSTGEYLRFDDSDDRFVLSDEMVAERLVDADDSSYYVNPAGTSLLNGLRVYGSSQYINYDGPDGNQTLYFYDDNSPSNEFLRWDNTNARFVLSDRLVADELIDGNNTTYYMNPAGSSVLNTLRLYGSVHYMNYNGPDGDQIFYFYNNGSTTAESMRWDDPNTRFEFSDELGVGGPLTAGSLAQTGRLFNSFVTGGSNPVTTDMTNVGDVLIANDLELGGSTHWTNRPTSETVGEARAVDSSPDYLLIETEDRPGSANSEPEIRLQARGPVIRFAANTDRDGGASTVFRWYYGGLDDSIPGGDRIMDLAFNGNLHTKGTLTQNYGFDVAEAFVKGEALEPGDVVRISPGDSRAVIRSTGEADSAVVGVVSERPGVVLGGGAFSVEALRDNWGTSMVSLFERERAALEAEVYALPNGLAERRDRLAHTDPAKLPESDDEKEDPRAEYERARVLLESDVLADALTLFFERHFVPVALSGRVPVHVDSQFGAIEPGDPLMPSPTPGVAMKATRPGSIIGTALEGFAEGRGKILALVDRGNYTPPEKIEATQQAQEQLAGELEQRTPDPVTGVQSVPGNLQVVLDKGADDRSRFSIFRDGEEGLGAEVFRVDERGNVFARGAFRPNSMDVAEYFPVSEIVEPGHVLVVDRNAPGRFALSRNAGDPTVIGVVGAAPGVILGGDVARIATADPQLAAEIDLARAAGNTDLEADLWLALERKFLEKHAPVALTGTVDVRVDAGYGTIRPGDLLMTSPTAGHAMRADEAVAGTIIGKALQSLDAGTGKIRMLVWPR